MPDHSGKLRAAAAEAARREAIERHKRLEQAKVGEVPTSSSVSDRAHGHLVLGTHRGRPAYLLDGRVLHSGDTAELYTDSANGWLRGRFAWSGEPGDPPRLLINLWDPKGRRDAEGMPPWIGEWGAPLPPRAALRRPTGT
jgi:hypothetical protein